MRPTILGVLGALLLTGCGATSLLEGDPPDCNPNLEPCPRDAQKARAPQFVTIVNDTGFLWTEGVLRHRETGAILVVGPLGPGERREIGPLDAGAHDVELVGLDAASAASGRLRGVLESAEDETVPITSLSDRAVR